MEFGNHVGNWEHITIRRMKENANNAIWGDLLLCVKVLTIGLIVIRGMILKKINTTHPVAYTALGSHGMLSTEEKHIYVNALVVKFINESSQGTA